ncbi:MAG TPA: GTP-binding protein [Cyclobacteriaceae bacterium]|nr:GTP-binding protein [Cyclobacteriaceae bacterium]
MKLILVGGFLGSGKTTAIVNACHQLINSNKKVAVVTNDQGNQQVDSAYVKSIGIPAREVTNGCFCCNYDQLDKHLQSFIENDHPQYLFAESVGSCTDLVATLAKPLNRFRPELEVVISVFADADLLCSLIEGRTSLLEESVRYIYRKQLEEADLLIINKTDLLSAEQLTRVSSVIKSEYPAKTILLQNSLPHGNISKWVEAINQFTQTWRRSLDLDYNIYGEGEGNLAWLDKSIVIETMRGDAVYIAQQIIRSIFNHVQALHLVVGHLKFFLSTDRGDQKVSFTATSTSGDVKLNDEAANQMNLLINARVQTEPDLLKKLIDDVLAKAEQTYDCQIHHEKWSAFKPGYPRPTYRFAAD